jgi:quercetin dioxygenase-like cupin family protein
MASNEMKLKYVKILADDSGETHFEDEELVMTEASYAPPAPPVWVGPQGKATGVTIVAFPPGWYGDFHPAPKAQWMMIMTGAIEVEVSDGEKRTFTAGTADSFAYLDDKGSKGHISRALGDELSIIAVTEVA